MTAYSATSGHPVNNTTLNSGDTLTVSSGGTAASNTLTNSATETVFSGGSESSTTILSGATAYILGTSGGTGGVEASGDSIYGIMNVSGQQTGNAGTATNAQVLNETVFRGGVLNLQATGAKAIGTTLNGGGATIMKSGILSNTTVENGGTITLNSAKAELTGSLTFGSGGGSLNVLTLPTSGYGDLAVISGFVAGDVLDARQVSGGVLSLASTTNSMTSVITTTATLSGMLAGNPVSESFVLSGGSSNYSNLQAISDGSGGTEIVACFASGTLIRTVRGDVAVEQLAIGDLAVTTSGAAREIRWLGSRTIDCRRHPQPQAVHPVRIAAHALGDAQPLRDLYVSPGHSICVDVVGEVLIPAAALANGSTIAQVEVDEITYWHVELDSHDIILAENLPAESYMEMGDRTFFTESEVVALDAVPDASSEQRTHADYCRPYHDSGPLIEVVRAQTRARALAAGWSLSTALDVHLEVDGRRVDPVVRGLKIRFLIPADAKNVCLVSPTARPCDSKIGSGDRRALGLDLWALQIDDRIGPPRDIALDNPLLGAGLSHVEDGPHRWTMGRVQLPAELWSGCSDAFFLRLDLGGPPVARWVAPKVVEPGVREAA